MSNFSLNTLKGDIFGGLTAAVVALPLALAFGVASGIGPIAGLYGAIAVSIMIVIETVNVALWLQEPDIDVNLVAMTLGNYG